jgi:hypothetical protein
MDMRTDPRRQETPEPTIGELIQSLLLDIGQLVRTEIKLAYAEVGRNVARARTPLAFMVAGALLMLGAFLTLLGALVALLSPIIGVAAAALLVAVLVGAGGFGLLRAGRNRLKGISLIPTRAILPSRHPEPDRPGIVSKGKTQ